MVANATQFIAIHADWTQLSEANDRVKTFWLVPSLVNVDLTVTVKQRANFAC